MTPYDWQEGIGHRSSYVESRLKSGTPVLMVSLEEGVLAFTVRRHARKVYEIYDRLMFGAIGQQSDVEQIRAAAIDFTHQEGYQRSEDDVTIQRVINALSQPLKRAFADFNSAPFVIQALFSEVGRTRSEDAFYLLDYDGDFSMLKERAYVTGDPESGERLHDGLKELDLGSLSVSEATEALKKLWSRALAPDEKKDFAALTQNLTPEVALLERHPVGEQRFKLLSN